MARRVKVREQSNVQFIEDNPGASFEEVEKNKIIIDVYEGNDNGGKHFIEIPRGKGGDFEANSVSGTTKFMLGNNKHGRVEMRVTKELSNSGLSLFWNRDHGELKTIGGEELSIQPDTGDVIIGNKMPTNNKIYLIIDGKKIELSITGNRINFTGEDGTNYAVGTAPAMGGS